MVWGGSLGSSTWGFLHWSLGAGRTVRPVARSHGLMVWGGSLSSTWGFLHLEEPEGGQSDGRTE